MGVSLLDLGPLKLNTSQSSISVHHQPPSLPAPAPILLIPTLSRYFLYVVFHCLSPWRSPHTVCWRTYQTLTCTPHAGPCTYQNLPCRRHTLPDTRHTLLCMHHTLSLQASHTTMHMSQFTLPASHSTIQSLHFTLLVSLSTLPPRPHGRKKKCDGKELSTFII